MRGGSRIAVIGAGVSGLGAAWYLSPSFDVHVFERERRLGGHTHTHLVADGKHDVSVDTGFIVYNETTYPLLTRLFDELGVESQPTNMSFSMECRRCDLRYSGLGASGMAVQKRNLMRPSYYRLLRAMDRLHRFGRSKAADPGALEGQTLEQMVSRVDQAGSGLGDHYVYPLASALWSIGVPDVRAFPASTFVEFFRSHRMFGVFGRLQWRSIPGGSRTYVDRMMGRLDGRTHADASVRAVERSSERVRLHFGDATSEEFDVVVFAVPADEALRLLIEPSADERDLLGVWRYAQNDTWLHGDASVMRPEPSAQASWNYHLNDCLSPAPGATMTYNLNRLQRLDTETPFLVTLNPSREPASPIAQMKYRHPIFTVESVSTQQPLRELAGAKRTWFAGAHLGFGFHEDGLRSAAYVAESMGVEVP